jgi:hypothetical protein
LASKQKTTVTNRAQDTITQQELTMLSISQVRLAKLTASCERRHDDVAERLRAGAVVEPGRWYWTGTAMEVRP